MRLVTAILLSLSSSFSPAAENPDFSGRWLAISPGYAGREMRITTTRTTLNVTHTLNRVRETVIYNLDGSPRRERLGPDEERWSNAAWKNGTLVLTETRLTLTQEARTEQALSYDLTRRLIVGISRSQLDRNRDPAAPLPAPRSKTVIVLKKRPS